jgi:hypothetical protein
LPARSKALAYTAEPGELLHGGWWGGCGGEEERWWAAEGRNVRSCHKRADN